MKPLQDYSHIRGFNYTPSNSNRENHWLEFYDHDTVDREMGYAERLRLNSARIFLQYPAYLRDPKKYLDIDHCMADASQGGNVALVNWLRALARETELEALRHLPENQALCASLNRLSSALYVLMLLTLSAQKGKGIPRVCGQSGQK